MADTAPIAAPAAPVVAPDASAPADGQPRGPDGKYQPKPGETPIQAEARRLKLRLTPDKEEELDEATVVANYNKGRNAAQILSKAENARREGIKAKQEAEERFSRLKAKPWEVLREMGLDPRQLAELQMKETLEEDALTPEQKKNRELEKRLREYEEKDKAKEEETAKSAHEAEIEKHKNQFSELFVKTMEATGLPREASRSVMHRMASLYQANDDAGLESTPEEMAAHVVEGLKGEHRALVSKMTTQEKVDWLGDEFLLELRRFDLARLKQKMGMNQPPPSQTRPPPAQTKVDPRKGRWAEIERLMKEGQ